MRSSIGIAVVAALAFGAQHARAGQASRTRPADRSAPGASLLANAGAQLGAAPLLYFADIRNRPAYCAGHVVPLEALRPDLAHTATTPRFAWIGPNDCSDMEGCGIHAGDRFLASQLGAVLRSPAWRTQRSLAIITVDEDAYNHPDPPQRVATLLLASSGVRHGYVSHARYTHYSLLRTIEAPDLGRPVRLS
ncbi:MAG TPA: alkaline phosphatase family protein, partial [Streptosporangiaceae bacterium]